MSSLIRKISVGIDQPNNVIHYQVGKMINLNGNKYKIDTITMDREVGKMIYEIFIRDERGLILWKSIIDVPVSIEYNIEFD